MSDCEKYEIYDVKIDTKFAPANNSFIGYLNTPLRNVVKAELLSASIVVDIGSTEVVYIYIKELDSKFNDRADVQTAITSFQSATLTSNTTSPGSNVTYTPAQSTSNIGPNLTGTFSNVNQLRTSLAAIPTTQQYSRTIFTTGAYWPVVVEYIEPIRQIPYLTVSLYDSIGNLIQDNGSASTSFLTLRFTCAKPNRCLY